jgi:hypothetical protein
MTVLAHRRCLALGCVCVSPGRHGYDEVIPFLVVEVFHAKLHLVFVQAELRFFAYRQQHRMFVILRTNPVDCRTYS